MKGFFLIHRIQETVNISQAREYVIFLSITFQLYLVSFENLNSVLLILLFMKRIKTIVIFFRFATCVVEKAVRKRF